MITGKHARERAWEKATLSKTLVKTLVWKAAALVGGLGLGIVSYPLHAAPATGGDTVQGLYDALLTTMKNGRTQSGRSTQLAPVIRRTHGQSFVGIMRCRGYGPVLRGRGCRTLRASQAPRCTEALHRTLPSVSENVND